MGDGGFCSRAANIGSGRAVGRGVAPPASIARHQHQHQYQHQHQHQHVDADGDPELPLALNVLDAFKQVTTVTRQR
jgi:hypothetical protein